MNKLNPVPPDTQAAIVNPSNGLMFTGPNHGFAAAEAEDAGAFEEPVKWIEGFDSQATGFLDRDEFKDYCGHFESASCGTFLGLNYTELGYSSWCKRSRKGFTCLETNDEAIRNL